jgi:MFS family permease
MASIVVFLAGSMLCGLSQTMSQLIAFRALQGLGGGGLMVGAFAIIGELVPPRQGSKVQAMMAAMMPCAFVGGPLVGGVLTDHLSWRWVFYVNLPVGLVALALITVALRTTPSRLKVKIDVWGALFLTATLVTISLATSWAGSEYPWASKQIIGLGVGSLLSLAAFILIERRAAEPVLPLWMFRNRNFAIAQVLASMIIVVGGALIAVGMLLLVLDADTNTLVASLLTAVAGIGVGSTLQNSTIITMNSVEQRDIGAANGVNTLSRLIGGSVVIALLGSVFTNRVKDTLADRLGSTAGGKLTSSGGSVTPEVLRTLPAAVQRAFAEAVSNGLHGVLIGCAIAGVIAAVVACFIHEVPLRGGPQDEAKQDERVPVVAAAG